LVSRKALSEEYLSFDMGGGVLSWQVVTDQKLAQPQRKAGNKVRELTSCIVVAA